MSDFFSLVQVALDEVFQPGRVQWTYKNEDKLYIQLNIWIRFSKAELCIRKEPGLVENAILEVCGLFIAHYKIFGIPWLHNKYDEAAALTATKMYLQPTKHFRYPNFDNEEEKVF